MRRSIHGLLMVLAATCTFAGCSHGQSDSSASPAPSTTDFATTPASVEPTAPLAPSPLETASAAGSPSAESGASTGPASVGAGASDAPSTPAPTPTPTAEPNLLSTRNGTILRSYSPPVLDGMNDGSLNNAAHGIGAELPAAAKPPFVFTFELASIATISEFQGALRAAETNGPTPSVTFAVSTTSANAGFSDVGTLSGAAKTLAANVRARWVRVTANQLFDSVGATGTFGAPPAALDPTGIFVEQEYPNLNGAFVPSGARENQRRVRFVRVGSSLVGTECDDRDIIGTFIGALDGRIWNANLAGNKDDNPDTRFSVIDDEAAVIAGTNSTGGAAYFTRAADRPAYCLPRTNGTGTHVVLVLDQDPIEAFYPTDASPPIAGYTFSAIGAGMLDASALAGKEAVVLRDACKIPGLMSAEQRDLLLKWVAAGHKLIVGGGSCTDADFTWLPYPFAVAQGPESTNASLIQIENDALGTNDKNDTVRYLNVAGYVADENNRLAGAAVVTTKDPHWCGHLFIAKTTNVNGFVQMYATYGNGSLVYDGFVGDDGQPILQSLRKLELALPVPADLPCTQHVTDAYLLEPNQEASFVAEKAQVVRVPFVLLANQGWSGHVTMRTTGDLPATVSPDGFDIAGGTLNLTAVVTTGRATKPGVYTVNVIADEAGGKSAQASVTLTGTAPLRKQFAPTQKRIRIYGIHFDVDSAVIQSRSEPVIAEIAEILRATPSLRFQVEGHTDSDGGAAYNLGLSQRRAQAVVDDLVTRDHIARSRLVPKGFGLTKPVASNATAAGKALNRRVELLRL